jgi:hypothetical protein
MARSKSVAWVSTKRIWNRLPRLLPSVRKSLYPRFFDRANLSLPTNLDEVQRTRSGPDLLRRKRSRFLLGFFLKPFFLVLGRMCAFIRNHPCRRGRNSGIASRAPRLDARVQNFLFSPFHRFFRQSLRQTALAPQKKIAAVRM